MKQLSQDTHEQEQSLLTCTHAWFGRSTFKSLVWARESHLGPLDSRLILWLLNRIKSSVFFFTFYLSPGVRKSLQGKKNHSNFDKSVFFKENSFLIGTIEPWLSPRATVALLISVATSRERTSWLEEPNVHPFFIGFQNLPLIQKVEMSHWSPLI